MDRAIASRKTLLRRVDRLLYGILLEIFGGLIVARYPCQLCPSDALFGVSGTEAGV